MKIDIIENIIDVNINCEEKQLELKLVSSNYDDSLLKTEIEKNRENIELNKQEINNLDDIKVDKVTGKSLIADTEIARLKNVKNYDDTQIKTDIAKKVDKEEGKGLSSNDFTNEEKEKLSSLENYDDTQVKQDINRIKEKIPTQATNNNQLADKDFVNSSLNSITAFYITKNLNGDQFNSKSELDSATEFYSGGEVRVPTRNDYCIILADETKDNATTRYIYQNGQWEFQYIVNETPLTSEQIKAINSGITPELVAKLQGIDLTNVVRDADYVHTDNNYINEDKDKLSGLSNDYTQLNNLPKINGIPLTGNKTNSDLYIPMEYVDLSSDTKTLQEIGEGCYIVSNNGKINTASGYSRVIGKGTEIIIVRTNKSGKAILCATFQDGANVYRIDDDASSADDVNPFLKRSDIDTSITGSSTDKKVPSSKAVYNLINSKITGALEASY